VMSSSVYDAPAPPGISSTFTATGAPFQNVVFEVRIESPNGDFRPFNANAPFYPTAAPIQRL
jgi:hypothetical protein